MTPYQEAQRVTPQLAQFTRFRDLPTEVRLMIWRAVPRVSKIFRVEKPLRADRDVTFHVTVNLADLGSVSQTCREARETVLSSQRDEEFTDDTTGDYQWHEEARMTDPKDDTIETGAMRVARQAHWNSLLWAYFDAAHDSIYLTSGAIRCELLDHESMHALDKLVGPIKRIIVPHYELDDEGHLFNILWRNLKLDSISLVLPTMTVEESMTSILSKELGASMPLVVDVGNPHSIRIVERVLNGNSEALEQWRDSLERFERYSGNANGYSCNWTVFMGTIRADWLNRALQRNPLELEAGMNRPIDEDGLILDYRHPWVRKWAPTIPQFKGVVMFLAGVQR